MGGIFVAKVTAVTLHPATGQLLNSLISNGGGRCLFASRRVSMLN